MSVTAESSTRQEHTGDDGGGAGRRPSFKRRWLSNTATWVLLVDLALVLVFTLLSPQHVFWSGQNFRALMLNGTEAMLLAIGLSMMLGASIVDLSLGANLVLSSVVGATILQHLAAPSASGTYAHSLGPILVALAGCLATGMAFGLVNGLIITYLDVNSVIATLGTLGVGTGTALLITKGSDLGSLPPALQSDFGLGTVLGVPLPALVALVATAILWAVVRFTRYGLHTLAIGSSRVAAERAGLRVRVHLVSLTIIAGLLAGIAGFVDISHFGATTVQGHDQDALAALTAVVIGGTVLEGGRISVIGTIWGVGLAVILQGGLVVVGVQAFWQLIAVGAVLIAAVALDRLRYRRSLRR